jgi:predicted metal-dependent phosphotriesterase family hydrolase
MGTVETVLGPVESAALGNVDAHEHVFLRTPVNPGDEFLDEDRATNELILVRDAGVTSIVDLTPIGLGRQPDQLATVARSSGVNIVAATGFHRLAHYRDNHWARFADDAVLEDALMSDLTIGMDLHDWEFPRPSPTTHRAGIVKLGASYQRVAGLERRWFAAGAAAALASGVSIAVHTEIGTAAHHILDLLASHGLPTQRVMLAHMDRNPDAELHLELLDRGAFLVYDTIGRIKYRPDSVVLDLIEAVAGASRLEQLCLGTDIGRRSMFTAYGGGPGMAVLGRDFIPRLRNRIGDDGVALVLTKAPQTLLSRA